MGDLAWVRKYRPSSFAEYLGDGIKKQVINRLKDRKNIPNTIMLYGTRGTGKTSMARLLCKEILCMEPVDGHSCGECVMCQEVNEYITATEAGLDCTGIIEVDTAKTTGKDDIGDIIEDALIPPVWPAEYKIIILDECHKMSSGAQNSLLKVIEEPPPHLIFILCTTDPDKVIATIHSRMQLKLEVKKKTIDEMVAKLESIAESEKLTVSKEALQIIAKKGDRVPRECINLLEQVAKSNGGQVTVQNVRSQVGEVSTEIYIEYFTAANTSLTSILNFNMKLKAKDIAAKDFMSGLMRFVLDCVYVKSGISLEDFPVEFLEKAKKLFSIYTTYEVDTLLQLVESTAIRIGTDDTRNELMITNLALRIGKIKALAKGLSGEALAADSENKASITAYSKKLQERGQEALQKIPDVSAAREAFASFFTGMKDVKDSDEIVTSHQTMKSPEDNEDDPRLKKIEDLLNQERQR